MDFYEVVDQVANLLRQRGRLTYRCLKLQFKLDDETLEAVQDELLFAPPVADAAGRGIVWTGAAEPARLWEDSPLKPSGPNRPGRHIKRLGK